MVINLVTLVHDHLHTSTPPPLVHNTSVHIIINGNTMAVHLLVNLCLGDMLPMPPTYATIWGHAFHVETVVFQV